MHPVYKKSIKDFLTGIENTNIINKLSAKLITEDINLGC